MLSQTHDPQDPGRNARNGGHRQNADNLIHIPERDKIILTRKANPEELQNLPFFCLKLGGRSGGGFRGRKRRGGNLKGWRRRRGWWRRR
jgi:hypothetical protein